jgi:hypothetical protein
VTLHDRRIELIKREHPCVYVLTLPKKNEGFTTRNINSDLLGNMIYNHTLHPYNIDYIRNYRTNIINEQSYPSETIFLNLSDSIGPD